MLARGFTCLLTLLARGATSTAPPHRLSLFNAAALTIAPEATSRLLDASPTTVAHGDTITVRVLAVPTHSKDCFVAAYLVGDDVTATAPLEYYNIPCAAPVTLTFRALSERASWVFLLGDGGVARPRALGMSNTVAFSDINSPHAVRLTPAAEAGAVRVSWTSAKPAASGPRVIVRAAAGGANVTFPADTLHVAKGDFCGGDAVGAGFRDPGFFHTALVTGLAPGTQYAYSVGDDVDGSESFSFRALPTAAANGDALYPFVLLAVGDVGQDTVDGASEQYAFPPAPNTTRLMAQDVATGNAHAVCHAGDISYARGFTASWELFHDSISGIAPHVVYGLDLGNHERDWPGSVGPSIVSWGNGTDSGGECGVATATRFLMPTPVGNAGATPLAAAMNTSALFWAAATGPFFQVHFSTEVDFAEGSDAHNFVRDSLAAVDRAATPFVIVAFHRPMYISSTNDAPDGGDQTVAALLRAHVEPLLMNAGGAPVDLVLYGHHHSYQRLSAVYNETIITPSVDIGGVAVYMQPRAPIHVVIGTGGAGFSTNVEASPPPYFEKIAFVHGYARISAMNASTLKWELVNDADGSVFDTAIIAK
jgi:hypothetical protein